MYGVCEYLWQISNMGKGERVCFDEEKPESMKPGKLILGEKGNKERKITAYIFYIQSLKIRKSIL
jgi:hypothetical protein